MKIRHLIIRRGYDLPLVITCIKETSSTGYSGNRTHDSRTSRRRYQAESWDYALSEWSPHSGNQATAFTCSEIHRSRGRLPDRQIFCLFHGRIFWVLSSCICNLSPDIVIHRLTGDGPKDLLIAPLWSSAKRHVLNSIHREFRLRDTWQGKYYDSEGKEQ